MRGPEERETHQLSVFEAMEVLRSRINSLEIISSELKEKLAVLTFHAPRPECAMAPPAEVVGCSLAMDMHNFALDLDTIFLRLTGLLENTDI